MNQKVRENPQDWHKCASYKNIFFFIVLGRSLASPIAPNQNEAAYVAYMADYQALLEGWEEEKELEEKFSREILGDISNEDHVEIATKKRADLVTGIKETFGGVNPVRQILHPIQIDLGKILVYTRICKHIVLWRENFYSFWITTIAFCLSVLSAWIPWAWLLRWIFRFLLIGGSGPWNKIWDYLYFSKESEVLTSEEKENMIRERVQKRYGRALKGAEKRQIAKERQIKRKAMQSYMYGNKIVRVPHFNENYFVDLPLPESYSEQYDPIKHGTPVSAERKYGQRLKGDMIPKRDIQVADLPETGDSWTEAAEPETAYDEIVRELTKRGRVKGELPKLKDLGLDALKLMTPPTLDDLKPNTQTTTALVRLHQEAQNFDKERYLKDEEPREELVN